MKIISTIEWKLFIWNHHKNLRFVPFGENGVKTLEGYLSLKFLIVSTIRMGRSMRENLSNFWFMTSFVLFCTTLTRCFKRRKIVQSYKVRREKFYLISHFAVYIIALYLSYHVKRKKKIEFIYPILRYNIKEFTINKEVIWMKFRILLILNFDFSLFLLLNSSFFFLNIFVVFDEMY